jgi:hypothetical protein
MGGATAGDLAARIAAEARPIPASRSPQVSKGRSVCALSSRSSRLSPRCSLFPDGTAVAMTGWQRSDGEFCGGRGSMRKKGQRKLGVALGLLSLLFAPVVAAGSVAFLCRDDSILRNECCCPGGHTSVAPRAADPAHLFAACCCDLVQAKASVASPALSALTEQPIGRTPAASCQLSPWALPPLESPRAAVFHLAHPPPLAIPILLGKQSFLI